MNKQLQFSLLTGFIRDYNPIQKQFSAAFITIISLLIGLSSYAQIPGNPYVDAGPDQTVDCSTGGCADLSAIFLGIGTTDTYTVSSIDFLPPSDFQGLGNQLNPDEDDKWTEVNDLPFDFCFFGEINVQYQVGSNGLIRFDVDPGDTGNGGNDWPFDQNLPNNTQEALAEGNIFSPVHDMDPRLSEFEEVGFEVQGVAPNRVLVVAYAEVPLFSCADLLATQMIVLYETTNIIDIYILQKPSCNFNGGNAAVGIQNNDGTVAFVPPGRNTLDSPWTTTLEAWRFTPAGPSIVSFEWLDAAGNTLSTDPNLTVCPIGSEVYTAKVTYTSCNGDIVVVTDDVTVSSTAPFTVSVGPDISTCTENSAVLTAELTNLDPANAIFLWNTGETTQSITVTQSGTYFVDVTGPDSCTIRDTVEVAFDSGPIIELGDDISSCLEAPITLDASPSNIDPNLATYVWSLNGVVLASETNATLIVTETGTYTVVVAANGCDSTDTIIISPIDFDVSLGEDFSTCFDNTVTLTSTITVFAENEVTYQWFYNGIEVTGETNSTLDILLIGTYSIIVSKGNCQATDEIVVTSNLTVDLGDDIMSCFEDVTVLLTANAGGIDLTNAEYDWFLDGAELIEANDATLLVTGPGTYTVIVTVGTCQATDELIITLVDFDVSLGEDFNSCFNGGTSLTANLTVYDAAQATFEWFLNGNSIAGETNQVLNIGEPGSYSVVVKVGLCTAEDVINVTIGDFEVSLGADFSSCFDGETSLNATIIGNDGTGATFQWFLNGTLLIDETNSTLLITEVGDYSVTVIAGLCTASDSITVTEGDPLLVSLGDDIETCPNDINIVTASTSAENATFQWFLNGELLPNETAGSIDVVLTGSTIGTQTYSVVISTGACVGTDSIDVSLVPGGNCVISQGISPNGDGFNDSLDLTFLKNRFGSLKLQVFNRLGRTVFELDNYTDQWVGQADNGNELPTGTYYYVIDINATTNNPAINSADFESQKTGWVYLNREAK